MLLNLLWMGGIVGLLTLGYYLMFGRSNPVEPGMKEGGDDDDE